MPYLFEKYCYETTNEIAKQLQNTIVPGASGYVYYSSCANGGVVGTVFCNHSYKVYNTTSQPIAAGLATFTLPTCSTVGPVTNESGLSVPDVVEVSWLVVLVLVSAYSIKIWRRTL